MGNLRESLVKDMFIVGITNGNIKERLLQEEDINLEKTIKIAKAIELTQIQARSMNKGNEVAIGKVEKTQQKKFEENKRSKSAFSQNKEPSHSQSNRNPHTNFTCRRCGQVHRFKCPAQIVKYNACHKIGHFAKCCFYNKNVKTLSTELGNNVSHEMNENSDMFIVRSLSSDINYSNL